MYPLGRNRSSAPERNTLSSKLSLRLSDRSVSQASFCARWESEMELGSDAWLLPTSTGKARAARLTAFGQARPPRHGREFRWKGRGDWMEDAFSSARSNVVAAPRFLGGVCVIALLACAVMTGIPISFFN